VLRRVCGWAAWRPSLALALHARGGGGGRLRLTFSRRVAARTAVVPLRRVCGWATWRPDSCPHSTREGRRRAAHPHSRTSSRLVLLRRVCGLAAWRPTLARAAAAAAGAARGSNLRPRAASRLVLLRRVYGWATWRPDVPSLYTRGCEGRRRAAPTLLSHVVAARAAAARLRLSGMAPNFCSCCCGCGRGGDLRPRAASRLVLLRRVYGWATWHPDLPSICTRG